MSKRNFILLIIVLTIALMGLFGFIYFNQREITPGEESPGTNFISQFNPFGKTKTTPPVEEPSVVVTPEPNPPEVILDAKLVKISSMPVAGFGIFMKEKLKDISSVTPPPVQTKKKPTSPPTEFVEAVRYVEKATGNIYQSFIDKIEEKKFSSTPIPKIYEAYFGTKAESVVMRYLKADDRIIESFVGALPKEVLGGDTMETNEIKGSFLPENITDVALSPDFSQMFYLFNSGNNIIGTTINLTTAKKNQVFDSPFTEWLPWWPNAKTITLTTKPSFVAPGYMYALDLTTKNLTKVFGGINGLTTLASPNGKLVLYTDNNLNLNVFHTDTKSSDSLGAKTLPEKCVWADGNDFVYCAVPKITSGGEYPDIWYQGEVSFSDQLWKIELETGNGTILVDPITVVNGEDIDGIKLALDAEENNLFFVNKKDSFLWKLSLK